MKIPKNNQPPATDKELLEWDAALRRPVMPEPQASVLTEIAVSVKVTIPLQQYGNIEMFVSQKFTVHDTPEDRETATIDGLNLLKHHVAEVVLPLVEAEVQRGLPALLKEANPDTWMQKNNSVYRWLRVTQPDMNIPAMEAVILDADRIEFISSKK